MHKLSLFFYSLKRTFTSPAYYADIVRAPFSFSLKFYYFFFFLFALIATTIMSIRYYIPLNDFLRVLPSHIEALYPQELEIRIVKGEVLTNVDEPYAIPFNRLQPMIKEFEDRVLGAADGPLENIFVIDTRATVEDFNNYKTYSLLTGSSFSYLKDNGTIETILLHDVENFTINQTQVSKTAQTFAPILAYIVPFLILFTFLGIFLIIPTFGLIWLVFYALLLFIVAKLMKVPLTYTKALQMDLHLVMFPVTIFGLLSFAGLNLSFPFRNALLLTLLGVFVLEKIKPQLLSHPESPASVPLPPQTQT